MFFQSFYNRVTGWLSTTTTTTTTTPAPPKANPMTPRFDSAVEFTLKWETVFKRGHYGDFNYVVTEKVSGDRGGLTKFGIDQRSHPSTDISALNLEQAKAIYYWQYWVPSGAEALPYGWGEVLFDVKVNGGDGPRMAQKALNKLGAALVVDGKLGPKTVAAMEKYGSAGVKELLAIRQNRYAILARSPSMKKFLAGWTNRNNGLAQQVGVA